MVFSIIIPVSFKVAAINFKEREWEKEERGIRTGNLERSRKELWVWLPANGREWKQIIRSQVLVNHIFLKMWITVFIKSLILQVKKNPLGLKFSTSNCRLWKFQGPEVTLSTNTHICHIQPRKIMDKKDPVLRQGQGPLRPMG